MRRNIRGTKWIATKDEDPVTQRPGPNKTVEFRTQQPHHKSHAAAISGEHGEGEILHTQSQSATLKATIYGAADLRDLPDTHTQAPSMRSWSNLRNSLCEDDEAVSPGTVIPRQASLQSSISSLHSDPLASRNSPVSKIEPIEFSFTKKGRKGSDGTIFPSFPSTIQRTENKAKDNKGTHSRGNLTDIFFSGKAIYEVGPKGEGQKLWSSYKRTREERHNHTEVKQESLRPIPPPQRPSAPVSSAHPPARPAPSQDRLPLRKAVPPTGSLIPRKESEVSRSSVEVPIRIDQDMEQIVDRLKPLPPVPQLQAAPRPRQHGHAAATKPLPLIPTPIPKQRATPETSSYKESAPNKPLPPVPHIQAAPKRRPPEALKPKNSTAPIEYVSSATTKTQYPKYHQKPEQTTSNSPPEKRTLTSRPYQWWKTLAEKTSETYLPTSSHPKPVANNPKATISRPRPFTALQTGLTANLSPEHGGVGGPGADTVSSHHTQTPRERGEGKHKATMTTTTTTSTKAPHTPLHISKHWREKFHAQHSEGGTKKKKEKKTKKRKDSDDLSIMCMGLWEGDVNESVEYGVSDPGPPSQMVPEPLFSGTKKGQRDTEFYRSYEEVLDEYGC
jgi:hypothetical protein